MAVYYPEMDCITVDCLQHVIQDANYNVIAYTDPLGGGDLECEYDPYGRMRVGDNAPPPSQWQQDAEYYPNIVSSWADPLGMHGLWFDRESGNYYVRARYYSPTLGRWLQQDPNRTGLVLSNNLRYHGVGPSVYIHSHPVSQFSDGPNAYLFVRANPISRRDSTGLFSYSELASSMATQGAMGGMINGIASRFAGGSFWEGFASGALSSGLGGAGYAFAASRAGFLGSVVAGNFAEGFVSETTNSFYNGHDFKAALVDGLYGAGMNVAVGGGFHLSGKAFKALGAADALSDWRPKRKNSDLPAFGPGSFRDRMVQAWGFDPGEHLDAHHIFPLELAPKFKSLFPDVDLDNPLYGAWWESSAHRSASKAYAKEWAKILNSNPTFDEVLDEARDLGAKYGFRVNW